MKIIFFSYVNKKEFNVINPDIGTGISGVIGKSFPTLFKINILDKVITGQEQDRGTKTRTDRDNKKTNIANGA